MASARFSTGLVALREQGTNKTPQQLGVVSDVSVDFDQEKLLVYGQKKVAIESFDGKLSIKGSVKMQTWGSLTYAALVGGATTATGSKVGVMDEAGTIPTTPFTITTANGATFYEDLGVIDINTGLAMVRVASAPATGQYSVNETTGVYTFATADSGHAVRISYSYTAASAGKTVSYVNQVMGPSPLFVLSCFNNVGGKKWGFRFGAVVFDKLGIGYKLGALGDGSVSFQAIEDAITGKPFEAFEMD